jgi:hypothetical protein
MGIHWISAPVRILSLFVHHERDNNTKQYVLKLLLFVSREQEHHPNKMTPQPPL